MYACLARLAAEVCLADTDSGILEATHRLKLESQANKFALQCLWWKGAVFCLLMLACLLTRWRHQSRSGSWRVRSSSPSRATTSFWWSSPRSASSSLAAFSVDASRSACEPSWRTNDGQFGALPLAPGREITVDINMYILGENARLVLNFRGFFFFFLFT